MRCSIIVFLLAAGFAATQLPLYSQTSSGSIAGAVRDTQQAAITNANVVVVEQDKKTTVTSKTDMEGRFIFTNLLPCRYAITVDSQGFKKVERTDINLLVNVKLRVGAITLYIGSVTGPLKGNAEAVELQH